MPVLFGIEWAAVIKMIGWKVIGKTVWAVLIRGLLGLIASGGVAVALYIYWEYNALGWKQFVGGLVIWGVVNIFVTIWWYKGVKVWWGDMKVLYRKTVALSKRAYRATRTATTRSATWVKDQREARRGRRDLPTDPEPHRED